MIFQDTSMTRKKRTREEKERDRINTILSLAKHLGITEEEIEQDIQDRWKIYWNHIQKVLFSTQKQSLETPSRPKRTVSKKVKSPSKPPVDGSKHVAMELYTTEGNYVKSLQYLRTEYMEPLEEKGIISKAESKQIFGNLGELIDLHKKIEQGQIWAIYSF